MALNIDIPQPDTLKPKITIFGVGGAGGNALNNMMNSNLEGVEFVAANTDAQALEYSLSENKIQLGETTTKGLGAGSFPDRGRAAAEENIKEIEGLLEGNHMIFIAAGMGGGTGTGAAPVIAKLAKDKDILTVGVVTKPFHFEGKYRMETAENGIEELKKNVDTLIVIPNQNLFRIANEKTTFESAFKMADDVLNAGVRGVTDLITMPGLVNLDFADIGTVMTKMGKAMMGTGEAEGENRAIDACEAAISNPLLDDISIRGAKGVLVNMTGGPDMTLFEADMAVNAIRKEVDDNANIIFGSAFDENMKGKIRVSVVATGIDEEEYRRNIIRDNVNEQSPSRFKSLDTGLNSAPNEESTAQGERSFFDPTSIKAPVEEGLQEISANDFQSRTEFQEKENLEYGKADNSSSEKQMQNAISQISFFSDDNEGINSDLPSEDRASKPDVQKKKKKEKAKEKDGSGFSLFSFMSGGNKEKDTEAEELCDNRDDYDKISELMDRSKSGDSVLDNIAEDLVSVTNDNIEDLDVQDDVSDKNTHEVGNETIISSPDLNNKINDDSVIEKNISLQDSSTYQSGSSNDSSDQSDDLLNVPAFFRRKNG